MLPTPSVTGGFRVLLLPMRVSSEWTSPTTTIAAASAMIGAPVVGGRFRPGPRRASAARSRRNAGARPLRHRAALRPNTSCRASTSVTPRRGRPHRGRRAPEGADRLRDSRRVVARHDSMIAPADGNTCLVGAQSPCSHGRGNWTDYDVIRVAYVDASGNPSFMRFFADSQNSMSSCTQWQYWASPVHVSEVLFQ